jgi:hypothetical protein
MSNYWDAVRRVAQGLPGSAEPRPRSIFEPEEPFVAPGGLETIEQEVDAPPMPVVHSTQVQPAPSPESLAQLVPKPTTIHASPPPETAQETKAAARAPSTATDARAAKPNQPVNVREHAVQAPPLTSEPATRVEVHRIETTRTMRKFVGRLEPTAGPKDTVSTSAVPALPLQHDKPAAQIAAPVIIEPPVIAVAEPAASLPTPAPLLPAPETPPPVIEIGRIDIRIASETAAPQATPKRRDTGPALSLDHYLTRRRGVGH